MEINSFHCFYTTLQGTRHTGQLAVRAFQLKCRHFLTSKMVCATNRRFVVGLVVSFSTTTGIVVAK